MKTTTTTTPVRPAFTTKCRRCSVEIVEEIFSLHNGETDSFIADYCVPCETEMEDYFA